jgi:hypothetical protein
MSTAFRHSFRLEPTAAPDSWRWAMDDVLYLGLTVGFFALTWALVKLCERV